MRLKPGVKIQGLRPEALLGIIIARDVFSSFGADLIVTSVCEGAHSLTSLHYSGCAFDCRIHELDDPQEVRDTLAGSLGSDFDVLLEGTHIHVEYQPRR